jgi:hypothetical protein
MSISETYQNFDPLLTLSLVTLVGHTIRRCQRWWHVSKSVAGGGGDVRKAMERGCS